MKRTGDSTKSKKGRGAFGKHASRRRITVNQRRLTAGPLPRGKGPSSQAGMLSLLGGRDDSPWPPAWRGVWAPPPVVGWRGQVGRPALAACLSRSTREGQVDRPASVACLSRFTPTAPPLHRWGAEGGSGYRVTLTERAIGVAPAVSKLGVACWTAGDTPGGSSARG